MERFNLEQLRAAVQDGQLSKHVSLTNGNITLSPERINVYAAIGYIHETEKVESVEFNTESECPCMPGCDRFPGCIDDDN